MQNHFDKLLNVLGNGHLMAAAATQYRARNGRCRLFASAAEAQAYDAGHDARMGNHELASDDTAFRAGWFDADVTIECRNDEFPSC